MSTLLANRAGLLNQELQQAKQNVISLTEQLEQAKAHLNMVVGHLNEVAYLMGEERKAAQEEADRIAAEVAPQLAEAQKQKELENQNSGEQANGEAQHEDQEPASED